MTIAIFGIMLVCGAGALAFINPNVDYHNLMLMGYAVFYLFFLIIYERGSEDKKTFNAIKCWTVLLTAVLLISNQVVIANVSYHKAQIAYEKSYGVLIRIADRIEQTPGAENCDKILVMGALDNSEAYSVNLTPNITGITDGLIIRAIHRILRCARNLPFKQNLILFGDYGRCRQKRNCFNGCKPNGCVVGLVVS